MKELLIDSFKDALFDTVKLIPFLLITYVVMEWLERKTAGRQAHVLGKAEKLGPLIGGVLGIVPQCGFSLMASNLYSGGVIGAGVLIAVFMSTSDEMLPIMLSNDAISAGTTRVLMERRSDSDVWGLVGGGCKKWETGRQAIVREVYEELGLRIAPERFRKLAVYDNPGRIAAFRDGSIWRMVIVVYALELEEEPEMHISRESKDLRFFSREEIGNIEIAITHRDIVDDWFVKAICE